MEYVIESLEEGCFYGVEGWGWTFLIGGLNPRKQDAAHIDVLSSSRHKLNFRHRFHVTRDSILMQDKNKNKSWIEIKPNSSVKAFEVELFGLRFVLFQFGHCI